MLTAFDTDEYLLEALRGGAVSFLLKESPPEAVVAAIHDAARGRPMFSPSVLSRLVALAARNGGTGASAGAAETADPSRPPGYVTSREWEVGLLVAEGGTNAEIAAALDLSVATVKTHLGNLYAKLHVTNRVQLAIRVLEHTSRTPGGGPPPA